MKFTDCIEIVGNRPDSFEGEKRYISTGALDVDHIDENSVEIVTYEDRPSRADLSVKVDDVIFAKMAGTKKNIVIDEDTKNNIYSTGFFAVRGKENVITAKCLYYLVGSELFLTQKDKHSSGATQRAITNKGLENIIISVPDYSKQEIVVSQLDSVSSIIEKRRREIELLDDLIKARFVEMFGDPIYNEKGWITDTVDNLCKEIYGGGTPSKVHPEYYEDGDIPWVSSKDMKTDILTDSQIKINQMGVENSTARMVPVNSVIMVIRSGILKHTLPVAINAVPITVNQDLKVFIPSERILTRFLAVQFKMHEKDILTGVRAVTADNIEFNSLKQRKLIVPSIELQQEYVLFLEQVDKSKLP